MFLDLQQAIETMQNKNEDIILQWDANNTPTDDEITSFTSNLNLFHLLPETPESFSTYNRGVRIIDHIWGSQLVLDSIQQHGYTAFNNSAWITDHRGLYIDLKTSEIFPSKINTIVTPAPRTLKSTNRKDIIKFLTQI